MKRIYKNCDIRFAVDDYAIKDNFTLKFYTNDEANAIVKTQSDVEFEDLKRFICIDWSDLKYLGTGVLNFTCTNNNIYYDYNNGFSASTDYYICDSTTPTGTSAKEIVERSITSLEIPDNVTEIGAYAFAYWSGLTNVIIPNSVTKIGASAFFYCTYLTSVTIPNSVTSIGNSAFAYCSLTSVTIPNSVTSIGNNAFYYCTSLTSVTIPNSVTSIGEYAFYYCTSLTSVTVEATTPPTLGSVAFQYSNVVIYVPDESVNAYKTATNWSNYTIKGISEK